MICVKYAQRKLGIAGTTTGIQVLCFQSIKSPFKSGRNKRYFTNDLLNGDNKYTANDICKMIEFLVDNVYVRLGG